MRKTLIRLLCCILAVFCAVVPVMAADHTGDSGDSIPEVTPENSLLRIPPEEDTKIRQGDYIYRFRGENGGYNWYIDEYVGEFLPRRSPDTGILRELEGYPVADALWYDLGSDIYTHLNRESGIYLYAPVSETECYLTGYTGATRVAVIPSELDGYTVVGIADYAFAYSGVTCDIFAAVVIFPDSMRYIGKYAFCMTSVSEFLLNDSLEVIDDGAFVDICQNALIMPSSLKEIGVNPFFADYYVSRDNQPLELTFESGYGGWYNDSFAVINDALYSLEDQRLIAYLDNMLIDYSGDLIPKWASVYEVGEGTRIIGANAFRATMNLEKVILPEGVTEIRDRAFTCCGNLMEINIPDTVTAIGEETFSNCPGLTAVTIPDSVTMIGKNAFDATVTITCNAGSAAELYCKNENIPYFIGK